MFGHFAHEDDAFAEAVRHFVFRDGLVPEDLGPCDPVDEDPIDADLDLLADPSADVGPFDLCDGPYPDPEDAAWWARESGAGEEGGQRCA